MRSSLAITALCATLAIAGPVKRALITDWVYETVTVTVTGSAVDAVATSEGRFFPDGNPWSAWTAQPTQAAPTVTVVPVNTPSPSSSPAPVSNPNLSDYASAALLQHNLHRRNHSSPDVNWDDGLANIAKQIAETCVYAHNT